MNTLSPILQFSKIVFHSILVPVMQCNSSFLSFAHYLTLFDNSVVLGQFNFANTVTWKLFEGIRERFEGFVQQVKRQDFLLVFSLCYLCWVPIHLCWVPIQNGGSVKQQPLTPAVEVAPAFSCCEHFQNWAHYVPSEIPAAACPNPFFIVPELGAPSPSS